MRSLALTVSVYGLLVASPPANAQQLKFEEASVKRTERCMLNNTIDPGMIELHGDPLNVILMEAFAVKADQIVGPSWLDSNCYAIDAKLPQGATKDQLPAMLQALLVERFKLASHKESKLRSGYVLVVDKSGPKFRKSDPNSPSTIANAGRVTFGASPGASQIKGSMSTASLARFVSTRLDAPVEDLTGLNGKYDIDVSWDPDWSIEKKGGFAQAYEAAHPDWENNAAGLPTDAKGDIFAAFRRSLGLKLELRKVQVSVIVIDHIEQNPTAN